MCSIPQESKVFHVSRLILDCRISGSNILRAKQSFQLMKADHSAQISNSFG